VLCRDLKKNWLGFILVMGLTLSLVTVPFAAPAEATHTGTKCLDVEPETDTNPTGTTHTVTATLRNGQQQSPGPPPVGPRCNSEDPAAPQQQLEGPALIYFEITGPNDPDNSNTPQSPDRSCTIEVGSSSCVMPEYLGTRPGTDTIRGFVADSTVDSDEPAADNNVFQIPASNEPDKTDAVTKRWVASGPARLDCDDQSGDDRETNPSSSTASESNEVYTCRVTDAQGNATGDADSTNGSTSDTVVVRGENQSGANDPDNPKSTSYETPDYQCTPGPSTGECTITVSQVRQEEGTAPICFWVDNDPAQNDGATLCSGEQVDDPENDDKADKVEKTWLSRANASASTVDAEPENDTNELGQTHRITATVFDQFRQAFVGNTTVNFEFFQGSPTDTDGNTPSSPDRTCNTQQQANNQQTNTTTCSIEYTQTITTGRDLVCVWIGSAPTMSGDNTAGTCNGEGRVQEDDAPNEADPSDRSNDNVDVVEKNWVQAPNPTTATRLDCSPEQDTNPTRSSHTITCTATNNQGGRVGGAGVDAEATGANDPDNSDTRTTPDFSCTTASQDNPNTTSTDERGTCSFTHGSEGRGTTNSAGTTTYRAWVDVDGSNSTVEADPTEARDENGSPGQTPEPDGTDVVEKTWVSDPATLTMTPEVDSAQVGVCNPFTITVRDVDDKPVQGATIDLEQRHERANDTTVGNEPEVGFCTPPEGSGPNRSDVDETRGDLGPSGENPDNRGTAGGETVLPTDANGQVTIGIEVTPAQGSDGSGTVTVTAFFDRDSDNDDPDQGEPQDTSTKTWTTNAGRAIDCAPEEAETPTDQQHVVTCTVTDAAGQPAPGVEVTFSESGPGEIVGGNQKTTGQNGTASVTVRSTATGQQTITGTITDSTQSEPDTDECNRAAGDPTGAPQGVCSDSVTNTWTEGSGDTCPGHASDGRNQVVGTEGNDTLQGTEGDDIICGLGGDDLIDGLGGNDLIIGGSGNDSLRGGDGNDDIRGGAGKDELRGNDGNDTLRGGDQNDDLRGNSGDDRMFGGSGFDVLRGGGGNDDGFGGSGNDTLQGFSGKDLLVGNSGKDTIKGGTGGDTLRGGKDNDVISGGKGPDKIRGGPGRDVCAGGRGRNDIRGCER
jgi:hypothetical protein